MKHRYPEDNRGSRLRREHRGANARRRALLESAHLGQRREQRGDAGRERVDATGKQGAGGQTVAHQLRGDRRKRETGARGEGSERRSGSTHEQRQHGQQRERPDTDRQLERSVVHEARFLPRGAGGQQGNTNDQGEDRQDLAHADRLAESPVAGPQQHQKPEREHWLHHRQRRQRQRECVERPPRCHQPRRQKPTGAFGKAHRKRWPQRKFDRFFANLRGLRNSAGVVEDGGGRRQQHTLELMHHCDGA